MNDYHQRASNYFDHNAIGNSNIFFPLTVDGARLYGWEVSRSLAATIPPRRDLSGLRVCARRGSGRDKRRPDRFLATNQRLFPAGSRSAAYASRWIQFQAAVPDHAGGNLYYGSGFTDGCSDAPAHLQEHTTFDFSIGKSLRENITVSLTALNLANRRFLLDNSQTFGGTHYADPRQIYVQVRYRFHY